MTVSKKPSPPGRDNCVACLQPTGTGLALRGTAEWHIAVLLRWGIRQDQTVWMLCDRQGTPHNGGVPRGVLEIAYRVCETCAAKAGPGMRPGFAGGGSRVGIPCFAAPAGRLARALTENAETEVIELAGVPFATLVTTPEDRFLVPPIVLGLAGEVIEGRDVLQVIVDLGERDPDFKGMELPQVLDAGPAVLAEVDRKLAGLSQRMGVPVWSSECELGELPPFELAIMH